MNERQKELLHILITQANNFFSIQTLSERLQCSERTVRNDLDILQHYIKKFPHAKIIRKRGVGVSLQANQKAQFQLTQTVLKTSTKTDEERLIEIAYHLLTNKEPLTLKALARKNFTHPATIQKDLNEIAKWIDKFHLTLTSKQRIGSFIEGTEFNKRKAIANLSELVSSAYDRKHVLEFFPHAHIQTVKKILRDIEQKFQMTFTQGRVDGLIIHALIMIKRTQQKTTIILNDRDIEKTTNKEEFIITEYLANQLEEKLYISIPYHERIYFTWHISSAIKNKTTIARTEASKAVQWIVQNMEQLTNIPFQHDDILIDGLSVHLDAAMDKLSYNLHITNPMLQDIKRLYPYLFSMVIFTLTTFNETFHYNIPEEEAGYITLHFQASLERMRKERTPKKVLVVCHLGLGMSLLLEAKLRQQYQELTIVDSISQYDVNASLKRHNDIDFIISTVPLSTTIKPHIFISPLLDAEDKAQLNDFLQKKEQDTAHKTFQTLHRFLYEGFFQKDVDLQHPYKIVERMANQLVRMQKVEESFTHQALRRERASFTCIGGQIAIPHAKPSSVKQSCLSMAILKQPIQWGEELVSIVMLLAINEQDRLLARKLLEEISYLSEQPHIVNQIIDAENKQTVEQILKQTNNLL